MERPNRLYRKIRIAPRPLRVVAGVALVVAGLLGFLPVVGFWMIPLGLLVLSIDVPWVRRQVQRLRDRWAGRRRRRGAQRRSQDSRRRDGDDEP